MGLKSELCNNLEGWDGEGGGRDLQEGGDRYTYSWLMLMFGRNQHKKVVTYCPVGEGSGTPLQYSCLENPMDGGAL